MENENINNKQNVPQAADDTDDALAAAMAEQTQAEQMADKDPQSASSANQDIEPVELQDLEANSNATTSDDPNLEMVLDIMVTIAMEVGRTKISIRDLLKLNRGSVVELDRLVGDPLDVLVNGTLIAHGEVVMVKEKFGIRLTDVISPAERVRNLK